MEWQQLLYFQCVSKTEHIGNAATMLHVTQPAVSMSIKKLEEELGVPLFSRDKKCIRLNKFGRAYLKRVEAAIRELNLGLKELREMRAMDENRVTVMFPSNFMNLKFMKLLYKKVPNIIIETRNIDYAIAKQGLLDGSLDICVLSPPVTAPGIVSVPLEVQPMVILTATDHPLSATDEIPLEKLAGERFVAYSEDTGPREKFEQLCRQANFIPSISFEANSIRDMLNPVRAGHGICLLSLNALDGYNISDLHILRLKDQNVFTVLALSFHKRLEQNALASKVKDVILECYPPLSRDPYV